MNANLKSDQVAALLAQQRAAEGDKLAFNPAAVDPHISPQTFMRTAWVFELDRRDALKHLQRAAEHAQADIDSNLR